MQSCHQLLPALLPAVHRACPAGSSPRRPTQLFARREVGFESAELHRRLHRTLPTASRAQSALCAQPGLKTVSRALPALPQHSLNFSPPLAPFQQANHAPQASPAELPQIAASQHSPFDSANACASFPRPLPFLPTILPIESPDCAATSPAPSAALPMTFQTWQSQVAVSIQLLVDS